MTPYVTKVRKFFISYSIDIMVYLIIMRIELISKNDISSDISGKEFNIGHIGTFAVNVLRMEKGTP